MTTGEKIKLARKKAGLTQAQLAQKLGVPYQSISQWERGSRNPKIDTLFRICNALNVSIGDIFDFSPEEELKRNEMQVKLLREKLKTATGKERDEIEFGLEILAEAQKDISLVASLAPYLSDPEPLSEEESALKIFLNPMGYDIEKIKGQYYFSYYFDESSGFGAISPEDIAELLKCTKSGITVAAKSLELKIRQSSLRARQTYITEEGKRTIPPEAGEPPPEAPTGPKEAPKQGGE